MEIGGSSGTSVTIYSRNSETRNLNGPEFEQLLLPNQLVL
jgi:hypothetical protein